MAWDDAPPTKDEMKMASGEDWDTKPPSKHELMKAKIDAVKNDPNFMKYPEPPKEGFVQGTLNALPMAGAMGGGAIAGAYTGGVGAIPGAAAGSMAGQTLKGLGEQYLLGKNPPTREEYYNNLADAGKNGIYQEIVGGLMNKAGETVGKFSPKPSGNAPQVEAAAQRLKVKPTAGMLTDDYMTRNTENSLGQAPSIPGSLIRSEQAPVREAINKVTSDATADASQQSDYDAGRALKAGVSENLQKRYDPISQSYDEIETHTKNIPLNPNGLTRIAKNIRGLDEAKFSGSDGHRVANQFANWLEEAENVNDIKILKTKARQIAQDPNSSYEEKSVASSIMDKLEKARTNSITRQAVQIAREAPVDRTDSGQMLNKSQKEVAGQEADAEGQDIGRRLIGDIKSTNKQYRGLMEDAKTFGKGSGLTKANKGMSATLEDINGAKPEEMAQALFDTNNVDFMKFMKEKMPDQFETARQQRLAEIVKKTGNDPVKVLKLTEKMGPEAKQMLFGDRNVENLNDAGTLQRSVPGKVGASDTPRGLDFNNFGLMQNARDAARYGFLKAKPKLGKAGLMMQQYSRPAAGLIRQGLIDDRKD